MSSERYDVVIVGGAAVGSSIAYFLTHDLAFSGSIAMIERDPTYAHAATTRSAASIRQQFSTPENIRMSQFGVAFFRDLKARFGGDADIAFRERGYLLLAGETGAETLKANHDVQQREGADDNQCTKFLLVAFGLVGATGRRKDATGGVRSRRISTIAA